MVNQSCIFCKIISKQIPASIIVETDTGIVIRDIAPKAAIHYLVIPKFHIPDLADAAAPRVITALVEVIQGLVMDGVLPHSFRTIINTGAQAGQSVFHLHLHVLAGTTMPDF